MTTGDPGLLKSNRIFEDIDGDGFNEYTSGTANDPNLRAGVLSVGVGMFRFGRNSETIRNFFQNEFIHKNINSPLFSKLDIDPSWYFYFGTGSGNTLW